MALSEQTAALMEAAYQLTRNLSTDAVLLLTEKDLDWAEVKKLLPGCNLLVAAHDEALGLKLKSHEEFIYLDIDPGPTPKHERLSLALLEAIAEELLQSGSQVVALYNGIEVDEGKPEEIDSLSILHLSEHLERLTAKDLRQLDTTVPLEVLRAVVDLATEIGREGREGKPVGTLFVLGDTDRVMKHTRQLNFNPFRGYARKDRDVRDRRVREQIKDIAQLEGAIVIRRDGFVESGCVYITAPTEGTTLSKGLGTRHWAAASISKQTKAIAIAVSQSSGTVRLFHKGKLALHIEPFTRPMIWQEFRMDDGDDEKSSK